MEVNKLLVFSLLALGSWLAPQTQGEECEPAGPGNSNPQRLFLVLSEGPIAIVANRSSASDALGSCATLEERAERMAQFYGTYGANLTRVLAMDAYQSHELEDFIVWPQTESPEGRHTVIAGSTLGFARYMSTTLYWTAWALIAKKDLTGSGGTIPMGSWMYFGMLRFKVHGKDFCVEYHSRNPDSPPPELCIGCPMPFDQVLSHDELGEGAGRGLFYLKDDSNIFLQYTITF